MSSAVLTHAPKDKEPIKIVGEILDHTLAIEYVIAVLLSPNHGVIEDKNEIVIPLLVRPGDAAELGRVCKLSVQAGNPCRPSGCRAGLLPLLRRLQCGLQGLKRQHERAVGQSGERPQVAVIVSVPPSSIACTALRIRLRKIWRTRPGFAAATIGVSS